MVLLTMTPSIVEGLKRWHEIAPENNPQQLTDDAPSTDEPAVGMPISHGQILDLWKGLRDSGDGDCRLEVLLQGAKVYIPPPPPRREQSDEYKALMARLRREEEERAYERMINPPAPTETFARRYPGASSSMAHAFAEVNRPMSKEDMGDDDITYNDVHRQLMLILNFAVSIFGVAGTLWVLARWWPTPARLFLTMGGSLAVGLVEIALYGGYIWHLGEAKKKDSKLKEVKQVVQTWVVGPDEKSQESIKIGSDLSLPENNLRRRKKDEI
ncbi:hypothetical protein GQ53DRAFT_693873 [Thozetella sp. PMI_491]|nr:hypothetical protein GQ53DRAFT_693873 [Thozetella sp. PMI_491]